MVYQYNDANWVTKITLRQTATPTTVLQSFEYGYDKVGNRLWVKRKDGSGDAYRYDVTYQLTGVKYGVSNPEDGYDLGVHPDRVVTYEYDALGNRVTVVDDATINDYYVNNLNQYVQVDLNTAFTYDTNGNLTADGTWTYGYDQEGRLISATDGTTSASYKYDAIGRRIEKNVDSTVTKYVYSGQDLIEERDSTDAVTAKYIYAGGIDNPVAVIKSTGTFYYQQDALGNVTALTDSTGAIVESYTYDAFGKPTIKDGSGSTISTPMQPFLFTGREYEGETELYHYRTRAYSTELGRFLQPDSIGFAGGDLNLYRYVFNAPTKYVDPMGRQSCSEPSDIGKRKNISYSTSFTPGGSDPGKEEVKKAFDRVVKKGAAGSVTKAFVGIQQMFFSQGAYVRLWIKGSYEECVCENNQYKWKKIDVGPENLGDYYLNNPADQQSMSSAIEDWATQLQN